MQLVVVLAVLGAEYSRRPVQTLDSPVPASGGRITVDRGEVGARPAGKEAKSHHRFPRAIAKAAEPPDRYVGSRTQLEGSGCQRGTGRARAAGARHGAAGHPLKAMMRQTMRARPGGKVVCAGRSDRTREFLTTRGELKHFHCTNFRTQK